MMNKVTTDVSSSYFW